MDLTEIRSSRIDSGGKIRLALRDIYLAVVHWRTWYFMGLAETRQRYRRSLIGPFWVTLTMGVQAGVTGFLLSFLFNQDVNRFLPFICISLIIWGFFSSTLNEGAMCFTSMAGVILQVRRPLTNYILLVIWRNAIIFLHTVVVFFIAALSFGILPTISYLLIPLGILLFLLNVAWMAILLGIISARYHDIPPIVQNALNVLVWLTPVYYNPEQIGPKTRMIIELNPLSWIIEVARGPFLNTPPDSLVWCKAFIVAVLGWMLALAVFARVRSRIPFWL